MKILILFLFILGFVYCGFKYKNIFKKATTNLQLFNITNNAKNKKGDTIYYLNDSLLKWDDFKGPIKNTENLVVAETSSGFGYHLFQQNNFINKKTICEVNSFFIKSQSWKKKSKVNNYVLLHEQKHFDITHYIALLFQKELATRSELKYLDDTEIETVFNYYQNKLTEMQDQYDRECEHGLNKAVQYLWNKKIENLLSDLH